VLTQVLQEQAETVAVAQEQPLEQQTMELLELPTQAAAVVVLQDKLEFLTAVMVVTAELV
jgi:hypothetical protein